MQAYDVADMFKQYLRELPECLVTNKLSDTFLAIYQHVPQELRLEALQSCLLLLPGKIYHELADIPLKRKVLAGGNFSFFTP